MKILRTGDLAFELPELCLDIRINISYAIYYPYLAILMFDESKTNNSHKFVTYLDLDTDTGYLHTTKTGGLSKQRIAKAKKLIIRRLKDGKNPYIN